MNNSWSVSCLLNERSGTVGAYLDRCVQLHDDTVGNAGQKPDIIAIFLGTNDYYTYPGTVGHQMMASAIESALLKNHLLDDHEHSYGSWITTTYPDCESGVQKRVCTICTAVEEQELAGKGHHYENGVCTDCGIIHTSTFQILDTRCGCVETFTYEVGMTWKEWLNSGYNTGMGSAVAIWVSEGPDFLGYNSHMDIFVNGDPMDYNDVICEQDGLQLVRHY